VIVNPSHRPARCRLEIRGSPSVGVTADIRRRFGPCEVVVGRQRTVVRRWPALTEVTVPASHFVPEDAPDELGRALAAWLPTLR